MAPVVSASAAAVEVTLTSRDGRRAARTFADRDGWFAFADVPLPPASSSSSSSSSPSSSADYLLSVAHPDYLYPDVAIQVSSKGLVTRAMFAQNRAPIPAQPYLVVPPISALVFYEQRKPLDVVGMIKSPYGLMVVFMLFSIFVMPMLKVDPEEYREAMDALAGRGGGGGEGGEGGAGPRQERLAGGEGATERPAVQRRPAASQRRE
jgi:hypothetical protein